MSRRVAAGGGAILSAWMSKQDEDRAKRLAEALRENLRRRKAQARDARQPADGEKKQED